MHMCMFYGMSFKLALVSLTVDCLQFVGHDAEFYFNYHDKLGLGRFWHTAPRVNRICNLYKYKKCSRKWHMNIVDTDWKQQFHMDFRATAHNYNWVSQIYIMKFLFTSYIYIRENGTSQLNFYSTALDKPILQKEEKQNA